MVTSQVYQELRARMESQGTLLKLEYERTIKKDVERAIAESAVSRKLDMDGTINFCLGSCEDPDAQWFMLTQELVSSTDQVLKKQGIKSPTNMEVIGCLLSNSDIAWKRVNGVIQVTRK